MILKPEKSHAAGKIFSMINHINSEALIHLVIRNGNEVFVGDVKIGQLKDQRFDRVYDAHAKIHGVWPKYFIEVKEVV